MKCDWLDEDVIKAVKKSKTYSQTLRALGVQAKGANFRTLKKYISKLNLDISHFCFGKNFDLDRIKNSRYILTPEEMFIENSLTNTKHIRNTLIKLKLIDYKCQMCGITHWQNQELSLHLDHINGTNSDNRLENLRFLCPNCHSLTETYCGRNIHNKPEYKNNRICPYCNGPKDGAALSCMKCKHLNKKEIIWMPIEDLIAFIRKVKSFSEAARQLNINHRNIQRHLQDQGIDPKTILH